MCQAIPRKVLQVTDTEQVQILYEGIPRWVVAHGIPDLAVGEYVVVYADQVLERMPTDEAEEMLHFFDNLEMMLEEASR